MICLCRGLTREGVLLATSAGASSMAEVREFCEANGYVGAPARNAAHDCCTGELAGLLRASAARGAIELPTLCAE